jgi:NAD(P)-dependent dehydrogenase (short-subunit alcohol dehydrogenase family)
MPDNSLKTALVTGASSGIGEATALQLSELGYTVYAAARRVERMSDLADRGIRTRSVDVTDDPSMMALVQTIIADTGRIDVLVNNAGYGLYGALEDTPIEEARRQFEVNVFGLARLTQLVLPHMRAQRDGYIVNISSMGGKIWEPLGSWYHASKFAVEGLSDSLRVEVAEFGIKVVIIQPGSIRSEWSGIAADNLEATSANTPYAAQAKLVGGGHLDLRWSPRPSPKLCRAPSRVPVTSSVVGLEAFCWLRPSCPIAPSTASSRWVTGSPRELDCLGAPTHVEDFEGGRHRNSKASSGLSRSALQKLGRIEEIPSEPIDIGLVCGQRGDAPLERLGRLHRMLALWRESSPHLPYAVPALQSFGNLLVKNPPIGGIANGVQGGSAGRDVVGLVEIQTTPGVTEVVGDHDLRPMAAYGRTDRATQSDSILKYSVG